MTCADPPEAPQLSHPDAANHPLGRCGAAPVRATIVAMAKVIWHVTMSLDGFIAGPDDSMDWIVPEWSDSGATTGDGDVDRSPIADDVLRSAGAILGGRRWYDVAVPRYGGLEGIYGGEWQGPVVVLTHQPPAGAADPRVRFVTTSLIEAVVTARGVADGRDVVVFGANVAQQCLRARLLDEIVVHLAPVLLGDGVRLLDTPEGKPIALERTTLATSGQITDLRFDVVR
jgi:dihydrofolate reductase